MDENMKKETSLNRRVWEFNDVDEGFCRNLYSRLFSGNHANFTIQPCASISIRSGTLIWYLNVGKQERSGPWKRKTNWTAQTASMRPISGNLKIQFGPNKFGGLPLHRSGWTEHVGSYWYICKRRCGWTVFNCTHWMIKFAIASKFAVSFL